MNAHQRRKQRRAACRPITVRGSAIDAARDCVSTGMGWYVLVEPDYSEDWLKALKGDGTERLPDGVPLLRGEIGHIDGRVTVRESLPAAPSA